MDEASRYVPQRIEEVLERISDGFVAFDSSWRYTFVNKTAEAYLGKRREELLGRAMFELFPDAADSPGVRMYRRAVETQQPIEMEMRSPVTGRWVAQKAYPTPAGLCVYFRDVTEQKLRDDALRESEARYRSLVDFSPDGVFLTAPTGEILKVNAAGCRMLGRTEAEVCALGRAGVIVADARLAALVEERRRTGHCRGEVDAIRADGTRFPVEVSSTVFVDAQGQERTSLILRDLTARKRAEVGLRVLADAGSALIGSLDSEKALASLARIVVQVFADQCRIDVVEGSGLRRVALARRDDAGETAHCLDVPDAPFEAALQARAEAKLTDADGCFIIVVPIVAEERVLGVLSLSRSGGRAFDEEDVAVARAITRRAMFALENERLHRLTERAVQARDDLLGMVAHDLRNPLNMILMQAALLRRRGTEAMHERRKPSEALERAAGRMNRLIQDLLDVTRIEAGRLSIETARVQAAPLLHEAAEAQRPLAALGSIEVLVDAPASLPDIRADRDRLLQILENLVSNATRYTPAGGRITLGARAAAGEVIFRVEDTGAGIPAAHLPHLFDRFWQARKERRGAGLGLAIVKGLVEAHGGRVWVESAPGQGTTFFFTLPLAQ